MINVLKSRIEAFRAFARKGWACAILRKNLRGNRMIRWPKGGEATVDEAFLSCAMVGGDHFFEVLKSFVVHVKNEALGDNMCARIYFEKTRLYGFKKVSL